MSAMAQVSEQKQNSGFKRVLIATDFSAVSERALAYALPIARRYGSTVSIVHAMTPQVRESITMDPLPLQLDRERVEAQKGMARLAEESPIKNLHPHLFLESGKAWDVLASIVKREDPDLLVLGTHGRGGLKKLVLGSVAEEVLRRARCPVLTVGPNVLPANPGKAGFKTILFVTDFGPGSIRAFAHALFLAEDCQAKLILLHMVPPMPVAEIGPGAFVPGVYVAQQVTEWQTARKKEGMRRLKELLPSNTKLKSQPELLIGMDFLPEGILDTAAAHNVDLIVMGAHQRASARVASHASWALVHDVICGAKCPVLTVVGLGQ
jgi:nucleotide-binding universal stress UspA family protein